MINIDRHIEILLLDNNCVIVPGLGGFMTHHCPARYCADTQSFIPPSRQLGFNAQLKINDSLLAQSYIEAYDISYPEALRRIEEETAELLQVLENSGSCELNDIGVLRLNNEGNIEFEPCEAGILTPELYGLNTVDILPLQELNAEQIRPIINNKPNSSNQNHQTSDEEFETTANETVADIISAPTPEPEPELSVASDDERTIRISSFRHVASIAAAIAVLLICSMPFGKMTQPQTSEIHMDSGSLYRMLSKDMCFAENVDDSTPLEIDVEEETNEKDDIQGQNEAEHSTASVQASASVKPMESQPKHYFSIVLASRVTRTNAEAFVTKLAKAGLERCKVVDRPDGSVKVIYGNYKSKSEANADLSALRQSAEAFAEGWIMEFDK